MKNKENVKELVAVCFNLYINVRRSYIKFNTKVFLTIYFCNKCFLRFGIFLYFVLVVLHISFIISHGNSKLKK